MGRYPGPFDDEQVGLADGLEFLVEPVLGFGLAQPHDQAGGGEEPDRYAPPAGEGADGDGEVGLACAGWPEHDHVLRVFDEVEGFEGLTVFRQIEVDVFGG